MTSQETQSRPGAGEAAKAMLSLVIMFAVMAGLMAWAAGTWEWRRGQVFFAVYVVLSLVACAWLWAVNPEIFAARRKIQKGTKAWDVALTCVIIIAFVGLLVVPALDDGRFHWAPQPDWVVWLGFVLFAPGFMGFAWAQSVNRHFEASVRIQTDRGHQVITTGPYSVVRHPGYAFAILMMTGMPLAMGSVVGLIPAGVLFVLVLIRTLGEDATLKAELPGYKEYAQRVRQRWAPGIW